MKTPLSLLLLVLTALVFSAQLTHAQNPPKKLKGKYQIISVDAIDLATNKPATEMSAGMKEELEASRTMLTTAKMNLVFGPKDKCSTVINGQVVVASTFTLSGSKLVMKNVKEEKSEFVASMQDGNLVLLQVDPEMQADGMQIKMVFKPVK